MREVWASQPLSQTQGEPAPFSEHGGASSVFKPWFGGPGLTAPAVAAASPGGPRNAQESGGVTPTAWPVANSPVTCLVPFHPVHEYPPRAPLCMVQLMFESVKFSIGASASEKIVAGPITSVSTYSGQYIYIYAMK